MQVAEWQKVALIASVAWGISGFYCGMHYPVAPALRVYEDCLSVANSPVNDCRNKLLAEWRIHSPHRLYSGLAWALIPIPLIVFTFYARRRKSTPLCLLKGFPF